MLNLEQFHWDAKDRTLTAEASSLQLSLHLEQVYPDACDLGFEVYSPDSGLIVVFVMYEEDRDGEGELQGQWYKPLRYKGNAQGSKWDRIQNIRVLIIND